MPYTYQYPRAALTVDCVVFGFDGGDLKVLLIRGTAKLERVEGVVPEYAKAAERYFSAAQAEAWLSQLRKLVSSMVRITITPEWVGVLDFQARFPSALAG